MANEPVSAKPQASLPLALTDVLYVVQGGVSKQCDVDDVLSVPLTTTPFSGARVATAADAKVLLESTGTGASTVTLPSGMATNAVIEAQQIGTGLLSFVLGAGTTGIAANGLKARAQGSRISARHRGSNQWVIDGDTTS